MFSCSDIDECQLEDDGCSNGCMNTNGSYLCLCDDGYRLSADGRNCTDIDECEERNSSCSQECINKKPGYRCECNEGFILGGDNVTCAVDVNATCEYHGVGNPCDNTTTVCISTDEGILCSCTFGGYILSSEDNTTCDDIQDPTFHNCPTDTIVENEAGSASAVVNWTLPRPSDNSGQVNLTADYDPGDRFPIGISTVTYTAFDAANNKENCSFRVIVIDTEDPVIHNCPQSDTTNTDAGSGGAVVSWTYPTASDNTGLQTLVATHNPGFAFPIGTTTVVYSSTDAAGNSVSCSFNVTVIDNQNPSLLNCPDEITANTDAGRAIATVTWTSPLATDNSGSALLTPSHFPGSLFPIGTTTVTYTAADDSGNSVSCSINITVTDNEDPKLSCPSAITANASIGLAMAAVNWTTPSASDNSGSVTLSSNYSPGENFSIGHTSIVYTAIDPAGNMALCSFNVSVLDVEGPVISRCPDDLNANTSSARNGTVVSWTPPTATDNTGFVTLVSSHSPGAAFPSGNTTVTYTATDGAGNKATCIFEVVIIAPYGSPVYITVFIPNRQFNVQLFNSSSTAFLELERELCAQIIIFIRETLSISYTSIECNVIRFIEGSVQADISVNIGAPSQALADELATQTADLIKQTTDSLDIDGFPGYFSINDSVAFCSNSTPCQNGGVCVLTSVGPVCQCPTSHRGTHCETDIDECSDPVTNDCSPYARCSNTEGGFTCTCLSGFEDASNTSLLEGRVCNEITGGLSVGVIIGIILGVLAGFLLMVFLCLCCLYGMHVRGKHTSKLWADSFKERERPRFGSGLHLYGYHWDDDGASDNSVESRQAAVARAIGRIRREQQSLADLEIYSVVRNQMHTDPDFLSDEGAPSIRSERSVVRNQMHDSRALFGRAPMNPQSVAWTEPHPTSLHPPEHDFIRPWVVDGSEQGASHASRHIGVLPNQVLGDDSSLYF